MEMLLAFLSFYKQSLITVLLDDLEQGPRQNATLEIKVCVSRAPFQIKLKYKISKSYIFCDKNL